MKITVCIAAVVGAWILGAGTANAQDSCRPDDFDCRIANLERGLYRIEGRLEQIVRLLEDRREPAAPPRAIDVPTSASCSGDGCASIAARQCREAGFPRGLPKELLTEFGMTRMVMITCMD